MARTAQEAELQGREGQDGRNAESYEQNVRFISDSQAI
jgi:hypothetical protein